MAGIRFHRSSPHPAEVKAALDALLAQGILERIAEGPSRGGVPWMVDQLLNWDTGYSELAEDLAEFEAAVRRGDLVPGSDAAKLLIDGRVAVVEGERLYIIDAPDTENYDDWVEYGSLEEALEAVAIWDGTGPPPWTSDEVIELPAWA